MSFNKASQETTQLRLKSDQHLGNCPKYITARQLQPFSRNPEVVLDRFDSFDGSLPDSCRALIERSSTIYLATRHVPETASGPYAEQDMGLNHRGGAPGFVRVYEEPSSTEVTGPGVSEDARTTYVVLPDYSGNRFYQSLGNVESDGLVGLTFPDFSTGDMLYLTGIAENLYEQEAEDLMPRVGLLTRVQITGVVYVRAAMQLRMTSNEAFSPYNPPVRYLRTEFADQRLVRESLTPSNQRIRACLVSTRKLSSSVRTFTFELLAPVAATLPGGFGIFDFSEYFDSTYRHMDESNPQRVNDDYIRTWTISSAAGFSRKDKKLDTVQQIDITVKHKRGGAVSSFLHDKAAAHIEAAPLSVDFVGSGGGFSCFSQHAPDELPTVPPRMLWIAGGVGITPFMAMWDGILGLEKALAEDSRDLLA
ncbi:MAG: oxidoreductase, partial [Pseudomonadota bacterium]